MARSQASPAQICHGDCDVVQIERCQEPVVGGVQDRQKRMLVLHLRRTHADGDAFAAAEPLLERRVYASPLLAARAIPFLTLSSSSS